MTNPTQRTFVVAWPDLSRWDVKIGRAAAFRRAHPHFRSLGEFVEDATEVVHPKSEPEKDWPVYGVNNRQGVVFSHFQKGAEFNAPYKRIRRDWFFHNPTRANVGSLGRVPDVPDDAITSPEYQVWRIKCSLIPEYMEILIKTKFFLQLVQWHRVGAVKERLFTENLREIPIPVLSSEMQHGVVAAWGRMRAESDRINKEADTLRARVDSEFMAALGLSWRQTNGPVPKSFGVPWSGLKRWGVGYNQQVLTGADLTQGKYSLISLASVITFLQYGTSQKANSDGVGTPIIRMNNIVDGELDLVDLKHIELSKAERESLLLKPDDILFNRTNSKELVGKCAIFSEAAPYVFASYLIRVVVDRKNVLPEYVAYALNSPIGRQQINALSRQIIGQANINSQELQELQIPLPPIDDQADIMRDVQRGREAVDEARHLARSRELESRSIIEQQILGAVC